MLPRYFNSMVRLLRLKMHELEKSKIPEPRPDRILQNHLYNNGFTRTEIAENYVDAKKRAAEQLERANANGGRLPVRIRIFDVVTDTEESSYIVDNFLETGEVAKLRSKILYAVNNKKAVEISAIDD